MSPLASAKVLPCSRDSSSARLSYSFWTSSRNRNKTRLRRRRVGDRLLDLGFGRQRHLGLDLARIGVENVAGASGAALDLLAADEMADVTHADLPELPCRPRLMAGPPADLAAAGMG